MFEKGETPFFIAHYNYTLTFKEFMDFCRLYGILLKKIIH